MFRNPACKEISVAEIETKVTCLPAMSHFITDHKATLLLFEMLRLISLFAFPRLTSKRIGSNLSFMSTTSNDTQLSATPPEYGSWLVASNDEASSATQALRVAPPPPPPPPQLLQPVVGFDTAISQRLELLTISWIVKAKEYLAAPAASQLHSVFPIAQWAQDPSTPFAGLCANMLLLHHDVRHDTIEPLPHAIAQLLEVSVKEAASQGGRKEGHQFVLPQLFRDGSMMAAITATVQVALGSAANPRQLKLVRGMLLLFISAAQKGLIAVAPYARRTADGILFCCMIAGCSDLLECVIHLQAASSPPARDKNLKKQHPHKDQHRQGNASRSVVSTDRVPDDLAFFEETAVVLQSGSSVLVALRELGLQTFRSMDASLPFDVTRAALRWISLCGGVMRALVAGKRVCESLVALTDTLLGGLVSLDEAQPHSRGLQVWSPLVLAALGGLPSIHGRVHVQWNIAHQGAGDIGANLLVYCGEVIAAALLSRNKLSQLPSLPKKLLLLARHLCETSGGALSVRSATERTVRHVADRLGQLVDASHDDVSSVDTKSPNARRGKGRSTLSKVSPLQQAADLLWGLCTCFSDNVGLALLWNQLLQSLTAESQRNITKLFEALCHDRSVEEFAVLLSSLAAQPAKLSLPQGTHGPLAKWLASQIQQASDAVDDSASPLLDSVRQSIVKMISASTTSPPNRDLFIAVATLLRDVTSVVTCPRASSKRLVLTLSESLWQLHQRNSSLVLDGASWQSADVYRVFEAVSGYAREERLRRDNEINIRRMLDSTRGHATALEAALYFVALCPASSIVDSARLLRLSENSVRSPCSAVRRAAHEIRAKLPPQQISEQPKTSASQQPSPGVLHRFGVQLFHDILSDLASPPATDEERSERVSPELLLSALYAAVINQTVPAWSRCLLEAVSQEHTPSSDPWQLRTSSFLATEIVVGIGKTAARDQRSTNRTDATVNNTRKPAQAQKQSHQGHQEGTLATELVELCVAWVRERRWTVDVPSDQRGSLRDASAIAVVLLSQLDLCATSSNCEELLGVPLSHTTLSYLSRVLPAVRPHIAELAATLAQMLPKSTGEQHQLGSALLSIAIRFDTSRLKDIRQVAVALLAPPQDHPSHVSEAIKRRGLLIHELLRVCFRSAQVRLIWGRNTVEQDTAMLDGNLQGIAALVSRIIPELMNKSFQSAPHTAQANPSTHRDSKQPERRRQREGDAEKDAPEKAAAPPSVASQLGGDVVTLLVSCIFPTVEAYKERNYTAAFQLIQSFLAALSDAVNLTRVAAALLFFADATCSQIIVEIGSDSLGKSEAVDERDVLQWYASLKEALQRAIRLVKSDASRETRELLMDTGLFSKDMIACIQHSLIPRLPVDAIDPNTGVAEGEEKRRWSFTGDKVNWTVKRRRTEMLSVLSAAVSDVAARRNALAQLIGDSTRTLTTRQATEVESPVPDVCRGVLEFVFDDGPLGDGIEDVMNHVPDDSKVRSWMAAAEVLEKPFYRVRPVYSTFIEKFMVQLQSSNPVVLGALRSKISLTPSTTVATMSQGILWLALGAKLRSVSADAGTSDLDVEIDAATNALASMASWAPKGDAEQMEARAAHCYVLLDWMRVAVLPTIRGDVHRLSSTLDTLQRAAGVARQPNSSGTTTAEGRLQEFLELVALDLCPAQHRRILLRHVAAFSHQLAQRIKAPSTDRDSSSSQKMQLLLPMFQYVSRDDVPTEERSHWITRLLIRLSDLPLGPLHDSVSAAAAASRHHWLSNIVVEVACAILCKIIGSTQASPNSTAPFFAKLLVLSIGTSSNGLRPGACFLVNSLRMSHPDAFRCVESVLGAPQRDALNSLHAYCTALESIASTPAELAAVTTAVISEEVDRFVNLYQEVLAEVSAMASEADQKGSTKPSVEEDLPELGAERNTNQASIAAPTATGNSLIQEAGAITSELSSWVQDHINALRQRMSERLQDGGAATWFDRTMWYVERSVTDLNAALPSAHPDAKGSTLLHAITTTNELVTSTREGLQRILSDTRNKANTARLCSQLSELLTHTCQCIRQDVSPAFRRASHDLRRVVEDHVAPWFNASQGTTLDTSNNASATLRTIDELFEGRIPAVLQRPIPVAFATQGTNESVSWKLDINFIDLNRSQECPRKIRFRGSRTTTAVPLGGSKSSRKQIHFTQTFILKGCQASDNVGRDHVVMALLRELQFLQHHANNGRVHNGSSLSVEQWMEGYVHPAPSAHATFTPCFAVYPFAGGGGLAEVLHGTNAVSALVDQWRSSAREDFMKSADDSRMPLPLSLGAPATQFQETLKLVVDEFNVRQQEARSRQRSNPRDRNAQDKQPPPTAFVDLNRPPPELIRETYLRLLRAQPSSRECISNAIFAEVRYDDAIPHRSVLPSDFAWVQRWSTYMRSLATGCALSYVLGIGDRHLGNILLCSEESLRKGRSQQKKVSSNGVGLVAHVDFSVCFGAGAKLRFPERIPFRMSPVFMHPLGAYGTEGGFAEVLRQVLTTVHQNESFILETTDALRWLVPLSGPVRKGPLATIANSSKHANNTSVVLRGSMVAVIDRVADRVHRQMDSLYAALMTVTQKHPSGQWMAIRNQIHQNSKFHSIASTGRRLTALTVESKTLRTEDDVDADASNITTRIAANKTLLNNAYDEFQDVVRSSQRVMNRLREVTSQIACEGRKWLDQPPNESSLLECALSIGLGIPPGLIVSTSKQPSPAHEDSLWQTASPIKVDGPLTVKGGRSISIGAWEAYLPSMAQQSGITSLLGGSATVAKQRLLQRDFASRQLMKLLETISSGAYDSSLLAGIQQEVEELQRNAQRRPSVDAADTIPCSLSAASHLAANLETDQPLPIVDDATGRMMELCSQWFATIRRVQWTNHQTASFSKVALDNVVANFTDQLLNSMPDEVYDEEILRSAIATAATVASHPLNESTSLTSVAPFQFQEALVRLVKSLFSEASDEVAVNAVRNVCTRETVHTIAALFCIECLSHSPINIAAQRNVWKQHFSETLVASRQQVLEALDGVTEGLIRLTSTPESCSKSEQVLGELAGLPCVSAASDVLRRFDDVVEEITTDLWSRVANASHEALLLDRQLNDVHAERSRIRQRSAVVFNEHRLMTELLRQSLTPVTLNPLSLVVRQVQVCLEGLYKELHTDLAETVLPRLLQRAGGTPSLARSPMQLAAHLIQRSEQEIVNILNMTHQLITEGYEELATLISRGATAIASRRLTDSEVTSRGERSTLQTDVEIASYIERLLVVTDSIFITASVSMFSHIDRLFSLLSSFGSHCASERLPRIRAMLEQLRTVADKVMLSGSSAELASSWGGQQGRKVNQIERLAEQLLRPQVPSTESFIHDAKIAVAHGDIHQLLDDLKKRIRIMAQDAQQRLPGQSPTYCVAPPPVKFLVQASIDADALSAMYPGWTAWI